MSNSLSACSNLPATINHKHLHLLLISKEERSAICQMIARVALDHHVCVFDGSNRFNPYQLAHALRRLTPHYYSAFQRVRVSRAFTCYEMQSLAEHLPTPATPLFVLEPLLVFYDEQVHLFEARRILHDLLKNIQQFSKHSPVVITTRLELFQEERECLLKDLIRAADTLTELYPRGLTPEPPEQLSLSFD